jgi:hypothetical protein
MMARDTPKRGMRPVPTVPPERILKLVDLSQPIIGPDERHNQRHEEIRRDVAKRLKKSCASLSEEDFAVLVERIVKVQLGHEGKSH